MHEKQSQPSYPAGVVVSNGGDSVSLESAAIIFVGMPRLTMEMPSSKSSTYLRNQHAQFQYPEKNRFDWSTRYAPDTSFLFAAQPRGQFAFRHDKEFLVAVGVIRPSEMNFVKQLSAMHVVTSWSFAREASGPMRAHICINTER